MKPSTATTTEDTSSGLYRTRSADDLLDIHRLMVHPSCFRRGIATELLEFAAGSVPGIGHITVSTESLNDPARALYMRQGFSETSEREVIHGLRITLLEKRV